MSGLAVVLAGRRTPGVYRWTSSAAVADVRHAVEHAGWGFVHLDTWTVEDTASFLAAAADAFGLQDGLGHSWDALADGLSDVDPGPDAPGTVVLWDGWSPLARAEPKPFAVALDILGQRAGSRRGGAFVVLMRGDGPAIDVPEVDPHRPPT